MVLAWGHMGSACRVARRASRRRARGFCGLEESALDSGLVIMGLSCCAGIFCGRLSFFRAPLAVAGFPGFCDVEAPLESMPACEGAEDDLTLVFGSTFPLPLSAIGFFTCSSVLTVLASLDSSIGDPSRARFCPRGPFSSPSASAFGFAYAAKICARPPVCFCFFFDISDVRRFG
jgi:hypothetical protein